MTATGARPPLKLTDALLLRSSLFLDPQDCSQMHSSSLHLTLSSRPLARARARAPVCRSAPQTTQNSLKRPMLSRPGAGPRPTSPPLPLPQASVRAAAGAAPPAGSTNNALPYLKRIERLDRAMLHSKRRRWMEERGEGENSVPLHPTGTSSAHLPHFT